MNGLLQARTNQGFTLLELIVVILIIGALVVLALPSFSRLKERSFDEEAIANLRVIQEAEKFYFMQAERYYSSSNITNLSENLKLSLPAGDDRNWDYAVDINGTANATRFNGPVKSWTLNIALENATCNGSGCL